MDGQNPNNGEQTQQGEVQQSEGIDYEKLASLIEGKQKVTEDTVIKSYLKQQGLSQEEMAEAIKTFKDKREAEKPDVDGMRKQIADLQAQIAQDNLDRVATEEALKLGLDSKSMPYIKKMADLTKVYKADGTIDTELVNKALNQVLTDIPALKPTAKENRGFQVGGSEADKDSNNKAVEEQLSNIFLNKRTTQRII
jgi:DNA polymerase I-like protein with 3'-5' exonuclease and polymerase domains